MKKTWTTAEGKELAIKEMEVLHIENCIRILKKRTLLHKGKVRNVLQSYIKAFKRELLKRSYQA